MTHSRTLALLWEIWLRHRPVVFVIVGLTVAGRLAPKVGGDDAVQSLVDLLGMASFLLLFGIFNYTDSSGSRGLGRFPRRLFTLPVSSLQLVLVPMLTGLVSVELLHLLWMGPLSRGGSASPLFVAVLVGSMIVFYQTVLWTLDSLGPLRLVVVGVVAMIVFGVGLLPSFPPSPPPQWRSEGTLAALVAGAAVVAFLLSWRHVTSLRSGGAHLPRRLDGLIGWAAAAIPARRRAFASPVDAHFWFEWRCSGLVLPILVGGVIVAVIGPLSWLVRADAADTFRVLLGTLATPIILAIPVGMGFAKPTFWSEDLSVPAFVAVRPLADEDIIAIKVKVARCLRAVRAAVSAGVERGDDVHAHPRDSGLGRRADLAGARYLPLPEPDDSRCVAGGAAGTRWFGTVVSGAKPTPLKDLGRTT